MSHTAEGGCVCGGVRYSVTGPPMCTHACHCTYCQKETGSTYALNAAFEASNVKLTGSVEPSYVEVPSQSGKGQWQGKCPKCGICVVSIYGGRESPLHIVRVGTFDKPGDVTVTAHIYTSTKLPWVILPKGVPAFEESYDPRTVWGKKDIERFETCTGKTLDNW